MSFRSAWYVVGVGVMLLGASGCTSIRYRSTLSAPLDRNTRIGNAQFSIREVVLDGEAPVILLEAESRVLGSADRFESALPVLALEQYPQLFSRDPAAIPLQVGIRKRTSMSPTGGDADTLAWFCILTALSFPMIFPVYAETASEFDVDTMVLETGFADAKTTMHFRREDRMWLSMLTPFAMLVPGRSERPRTNVAFGGDQYSQSRRYSVECCVAAVIKDLLAMDPALLEAAYEKRKSSVQEATLDGKPVWTLLVPVRSRRMVGAGFDEYWAAVYPDHPYRSLEPMDSTRVATRQGNRWVSASHYLTKAANLHVASPVIEGDDVVRATIQPIQAPPLDDFVDICPDDSLTMVRWRTGGLIQAKNMSVNKLLREGSEEGLLAMTVQIEKAILAANARIEKLKFDAERAVQTGQGDPAPMHEEAVAYQERLGILKIVLGAIKQELTGRAR